MDTNTLIFLIVAVAAIAILYFAWPRKKAAPPKAAPTIEAPAQPVTPPAAPKLAEPEPVAAAKPKAKAKAPAKSTKAKSTKAKTVKAAAPAKMAAAKPAAKAETKPVAKKAPAKPEPKAKAAVPVKAKDAPAPTTKKADTPKTAAPAPKAAVKPKPAPKAKPKAAASKPAAAPAIPDNIELLKGVGPKLAVQLKSLGVTSLQQVASWGAADITEIDSKLGVFAGRPARDNWVDQAKLLAAGDIAGFEKKYGALGSEIAKG